LQLAAKLLQHSKFYIEDEIMFSKMRFYVRREYVIRMDIFTYGHLAAAMERTVTYPTGNLKCAQGSKAFEGQGCNGK
jgi:hypothetical protein